MHKQTASHVRTRGETLAHSISHALTSLGVKPDTQNEKEGRNDDAAWPALELKDGEGKTSRDTSLLSRSA